MGFAQEGWYIELPKDANGNTVVAVEYSTLENGDISIKTYKRKFDFELAAVVADRQREGISAIKIEVTKSIAHAQGRLHSRLSL